MKSRRMTDQDKVYILEGYTQGLLTMAHMAKTIGVSRQAIHKALTKAGIDIKAASHIPVSCTVCGEPTIKRRCMFRKSAHHFCGEACYFAWLKHGNGNPLVIHRQSARSARKITQAHFALTPEMIVHHEDRNQFNNDLNNLKVFKNQGDHIRYHRGGLSTPLWTGKK